MRMILGWSRFAAVLLVGGGAASVTAQPGQTDPGSKPFTETTMATVDRPRAMTFLPDGRFLVTQQGGAVLLFTADARQHVTLGGVPAFDDVSQGGLRDVALHPDFARNHLIYLTGVQTDGRKRGLVLVLARFAEERGPARLEDARTILRAAPRVTSTIQFSGRMAFTPKGRFLMLTVGENAREELAQDKVGTLGKVLRLTPDGAPAPNNPLVAQGFGPAVWSYGHRNLYGLAFDGYGNLCEHEMGPMGGDEVT